MSEGYKAHIDAKLDIVDHQTLAPQNWYGIDMNKCPVSQGSCANHISPEVCLTIYDSKLNILSILKVRATRRLICWVSSGTLQGIGTKDPAPAWRRARLERCRGNRMRIHISRTSTITY